ncbi:hypothetical protein GCM10010124_23390 [Pilimelia terevasa]|uniref:O-antigen ligase-related domain-containing protein n=1 Tax=Pilimelia terevasa TaxID=53372 RepID=A0A8J3BS68_9ACTN|nr:O-antigen ligase family protein [Pilimelia terevasa]GGK29967.1 hypothetical protein GCM10010124_23390 [Pilimelia terevasa]
MRRADRIPAAPPLLVGALFLVVLGGRFAPVGGADGIAGLDVRTLACLVLLLVATTWSFAGPAARLPLRPVGGVLLLCGYLLLAALWAPPSARLGSAATDIAMLVALILTTALVAARDPQRVVRWFFLCSLAAAVVFALGAWWAGPGLQGRYAAFGGGPNVFVRIQCLGVIAAVALAVRSRRLRYLLPTPLLLYSAFLSGSRGGLAALIVAGALGLVLARRLRLGHAVGVLAVSGGLAVVAYVAGNRAVGGVYRRYSLAQLEDSDFSVRPELLRRAWRVFLDDPVAGAGLDGFQALSGRYIGIDYPHNVVAQIGADGGLVGLALLAGALWWQLRTTGAGRSLASWDRGGCAVAAAYVAAASMFSGSYYDTRQWWVYLTLLAALAVGGGAAPGAPPPAAARAPTPRAGTDRRELVP